MFDYRRVKLLIWPYSSLIWPEMVAKKLFLGKLMEHIGKSDRARTCTHGYARKFYDHPFLGIQFGYLGMWVCPEIWFTKMAMIGCDTIPEFSDTIPKNHMNWW